jgi:glycosyltransferase involved in cell wall biosynthesis
VGKLDSYPKISVVIPSYNQGVYIEETILSVIGQSYPNLEIIVIDGGSTDNTVEVLEKYSKYLSYWHSRKDKGQADAINQGMKISSGDILCWLNSDDMYLPGTLLDIGKRFHSIVDEHHLAYGAALTMNQHGERVRGGAVTGEPFDLDRLTYSDYVVQPSSFWTRKLWERTGELNIKYEYVLDWEWFVRASKVSKFEYIQRFYSVFRFHPLHKTSNGGEKRRGEIRDIVKEFSSGYWVELYEDVMKHYNLIIGTRRLLNRWRIPRADTLARLLYSKLYSKKSRNPRHIRLVWGMIGS